MGGRTGCRWCPLAGSGISDVETFGSAITMLIRWISGRDVGMGGGWNWLRIMSSGGFFISGVETLGSAVTESD
jgi:hypothetical protein